MKILVFTLLIIISTIACRAQNVFSAVNHDKAYDVRPTPYAEEVITESTFYNSSSTEYKKSITKLTSDRKIISEERFDIDGNKTELLIFKYDSLGRSIARRFDRWAKYIGHTVETAYYTYDPNGFLISITDRDGKNNVYMTTEIINNEKGYPVELKTFDGLGKMYGKETTTYDYDNNKYTVTYWNSKGEKISESNSKIDFDESKADDIVNEAGDITKSGINEYEYKYDKYNNWTKMTIYKVENGKKVKKSVFKRSIKYGK